MSKRKEIDREGKYPKDIWEKAIELSDFVTDPHGYPQTIRNIASALKAEREKLSEPVPDPMYERPYGKSG